jgi:hypothetical protein
MMMPKKWEIRIGDSVFVATLLEKLAPVTCATLSKYVPYDGEAVHASWSGDCLCVPWKTEIIAPEYTCATIYGSPGDVAWHTLENDEIYITHGISQYRYRFGPLLSNLFAKITDNLDQLSNVGAEIRRKGIRKISIEEI